jgi:HD-like signal output (HDOD) protein
MDREAMQRRLEGIEEIQTLPLVYLRVNRLLEDPNVPAAALGQAIEQDQALALTLLRLVNSSFYGLRSRVGSVAEAVLILGFNTLRSAVLSVSVMQGFARCMACADLDAGVLWRHALATAVVNRRLALLTRRESPDDSFIAGLLHDLGKLVLLQYFRQSFAPLWEAVRLEGGLRHETEIRLLPMAHSTIGALLAQRWQLPPSLVAAIGGHHDPPERQAAPLVHLTMAADRIVHRCLPTQVGAPPAPGPEPVWPDWLAGHVQAADAWFAALRPEIEESWQLLSATDHRRASGQRAACACQAAG